MSYIKYSRSFVILEDKESQFRNTHQSIKGHVKIEFRNNRGTIKCIAQNLKYYDDAQYLYKLYLFGNKDGKTILANAGTLFIDPSGKGEQVFRFNTLNVDGENNELFDYSIIAVVAQPNKDILDEDTLFPVLAGNIKKNASESTDKIINIKEQEVPEKISKAAPVIKEKTIHAAPQSVGNALGGISTEPLDLKTPESTDNKKESSIEPKIKEDKIEEAKVEKDKIEEAKVEEDKIKVEIDSEPKQANAAWHTPPADIGSSPSPELESIQRSVDVSNINKKSVSSPSNKPKLSMKPYDAHSYFNNYVCAVSSNLENVLPFYNQAEPFDQDKVGCRWWKIMNLMSIPFVNTSYLQGYTEYIRPYSMFNQSPKEVSSSCHDLIYKYQHYIFGIDKDENDNVLYYYYGIPGRYMKEEQPDKGKSGFEYWQPLQGTKKKKGDYGYWIMAVNAKTGELEIPFEE